MKSAPTLTAIHVGSLMTDEGPRHDRATSIGATSTRVVVGLLIFAAIWLGQLAHTSLSPPMDNIEQLTWARALEWGYYKHPPLPTWLIWLPSQVFGATAWTSYILGATFSLASMWIMWRLVATLRGKTHATVALLAALCITYYNGRLYYFNHNIVLMLLAAASAALCWKAFSTRRLRWWAALGLVLGLGALTKYQVVITLVSILVFACHQRAWREPAHRLGLLLASLIALLVFTPHIFWLRAHDFAPVNYALESSLGARFDASARTLDSLHWLIDQVLNRFLPALLFLMVLGFRGRRRVSGTTEGVVPVRSPGGDASRAFLLVWGLTPLIFVTIVGILFGADLQMQWGTSFLLFAAPAAMEILGSDAWRKSDLVEALRIFVVIQGLLLLLSFVTSPRGPTALRDHLWHAFDSAELAKSVAAKARVALGGPVRVVSGDAAMAGALALQMPEHPLVLIDGRFERSPWVDPALVEACGMLELGPLSKLARGIPVGPAFPDLAWRVTNSKPGLTCPP